MKKQNKKKYLFLSVIFLTASFSLAKFNKAEASDECKVDCDEQCAIYPADSDQNKDCRDQCQADEDQCKTLSSKAKVYEGILKLNGKQQSVLSNQLEGINQQQSQNYQKLKDAENKLDELTKTIKFLERNITEKEKNITYQKKILAGLIQSYYDYDQQGLLKIILLNNDFSSSFTGQTDYIEQSGIKVKDVLMEIKKTQQELVKNKEDLKKNYDDISQTKNELQDQKQNLQTTENQKQSLLIKTQGEEEKYTALLAQIEEQKRNLFNFGSFGSYSISEKDRPSSADQLSNSWYYSQKDSRWGNMNIGVSSDKMKDYGCAISSVAMVYTYYGKRYTPKDILKKFDFDGSLIYWPDGWKDTGYKSGLNYKSILDNLIDNDDVAIIHLKFSGGGHFIVVGGKDKNDYIVHDPYFGSNIYLRASLSILNARVDRVIYQ